MKIDVIERLTESKNENAPQGSTAISIPPKYQDKLSKSIFIHSNESIPEISDISSTKVRMALRNRPSPTSWLYSFTWWLSNDLKLLKRALQPQVYRYIMDHDLYRNSVVESVNSTLANDCPLSSPSRAS